MPEQESHSELANQQEDKQEVCQDEHPTHVELVAVVADKAARKMRARREQGNVAWFGLGMFGMIGWSVAVPMVVFIALGIWIDARWSSRFSWTLMLLLFGITLGCINAWYWVTRERDKIEQHNSVGEDVNSLGDGMQQDGEVQESKEIE